MIYDEYQIITESQTTSNDVQFKVLDSIFLYPWRYTIADTQGVGIITGKIYANVLQAMGNYVDVYHSTPDDVNYPYVKTIAAALKPVSTVYARYVMTLSYLGKTDGAFTAGPANAALCSAPSGLMFSDFNNAIFAGITPLGRLGIYKFIASTNTYSSASASTEIDLSSLYPGDITFFVDYMFNPNGSGGHNLFTVIITIPGSNLSISNTVVFNVGVDFSGYVPYPLIYASVAKIKFAASAITPPQNNEWPATLSENNPNANLSTSRALMPMLKFSDAQTQGFANNIIVKYMLKFWLARTYQINLMLESQGISYKPSKLIVDNRRNNYTVLLNYNLLDVIIAPKDRYEMIINSEYDNITLYSTGLETAFVYVLGAEISETYKTFGN